MADQTTPAAAGFWGPRAKIGLHYMLQFTSYSLVMPFWNLLFRRAGLSEAQIGVIAALRPWVSAPSSVGLSALADRLSIHRSMYFTLTSLGVLLRSLVAAPLPGPFWGILVVAISMEIVTAPCGVLTDAAVVASLPDSKGYGRLRAWGAVGWGIFSLVGGAVLARWGVLAVYALYWLASGIAIAWAAIALPFGALQKHLIGGRGEEEEEDGMELTEWKPNPGTDILPGKDLDASSSMESVSFVGEEKAQIGFDGGVAAGIMCGEGEREVGRSSADEIDMGGGVGLVMGGAVSASCREEDRMDEEAEGGSSAELRVSSPNSTERLWAVVSDPDVLFFLSLVLTMGTAVGVIDGYLFLYLEELGAHETLMGATLTFTCISEVPILFFSSAILTKLGTDGTLHLVVACFLLRLAAYSTLAYWPAPWMVLPVELLHGVTFGCAWAAGTHKCAEIAPPGLGATVQSLFQTMYFGFGRGLGALVGGVLYKAFGAMVMYRCAFGWVSIGWLLNGAARLLRERWRLRGGAGDVSYTALQPGHGSSPF